MSSQISQFIWHSYGGPISSTARTATEIQARREEYRIRLMALCRAVDIGIDWEDVKTAMLVIFGLPESQQAAENYDAVYRCVSNHGRLPESMDELEAMQQWGPGPGYPFLRGRAERFGWTRTIGNTACANNAESPHLRCAVNPCGPCEGCPEFEAKP